MTATAARKMQDRASKALDMLTAQSRGDQFATGRKNKDGHEGPHLSLDHVMKGVTIGWLAQAFGLNHTQVKNKLRECPPLRAYRGGFVYDIRVAATYLVKPRFNIEEFIKHATVHDLPARLQKEFWGAKQARLSYEEEAGHLWRSDKVMEVYGKIFLLVKSMHQQWAAKLETTVGLSDAQLSLLTKLIDELQNELYKSSVKTIGDMAKNLSVLGEEKTEEDREKTLPESNYVEDDPDWDAEDEEALIASVV